MARKQIRILTSEKNAEAGRQGFAINMAVHEIEMCLPLEQD